MSARATSTQDGGGEGLSQSEAEQRLHAAGGPRRTESSRSYAAIVRANVLTFFNLVLAGFAVLTLVFGEAQDALFLGVLVANTAIGIFQEARAKRSLDRLALLVAPRARVLRDGRPREVATEEVVAGDAIEVAPGDQIVADGELVVARDMRLDESVLTGESEAVGRTVGEEVRSGAFVVEGTGRYIARRVGEQSFAAQITGEARTFRHSRSPLERAINRLLFGLTGLVVLFGALLAFSLHHRRTPFRESVSTATAGVVTLIPEGLMLLTSLTYAVGAARMSRKGILAQQLNALESLASVDTICVDKTGTLTEAKLRVVELIPAPGHTEEELRGLLGDLAASASARNLTTEAIAQAIPAPAAQVHGEVPFSSRRRWSAIELDGADGPRSLYLGAPGRVPVGELAAAAGERQSHGRRVLALAGSRAPLAQAPDELPPDDLEALGLVVLAEELRPGIREGIAFLKHEGVDVRVLSGDAPETVAAIARDVGIDVRGIASGEEIPAQPDALAEFALATTVVGRIPPEGKRAVVGALRDQGRYVAMVGDGVNDVPALKLARLAIAQGSGAQMARSVADLVLISGDFTELPTLVREGRQALRNLQRVATLYVTKSTFAMFLILTIGLGSDAYPLLPRQLSIAGALTLGIPTFFLALAPSTGPWRPQGFVTRVARFATPAGAVIGTALVAGYLFALHNLDYGVHRSRTVALTVLMIGGLYLVMAIETGGSRRRSLLVAGMCASLAGIYVLALLLGVTQRFFELTLPNAGMIATGVLAGLLCVGGLWACGFTLLTAPAEPRASPPAGPPDPSRSRG